MVPDRAVEPRNVSRRLGHKVDLGRRGRDLARVRRLAGRLRPRGGQLPVQVYEGIEHHRRPLLLHHRRQHRKVGPVRDGLRRVDDDESAMGRLRGELCAWPDPPEQRRRRTSSRCWRMRPASHARGLISSTVMPVTESPLMSACWRGAAPRYLASWAAAQRRGVLREPRWRLIRCGDGRGCRTWAVATGESCRRRA